MDSLGNNPIEAGICLKLLLLRNRMFKLGSSVAKSSFQASWSKLRPERSNRVTWSNGTVSWSCGCSLDCRISARSSVSAASDDDVMILIRVLILYVVLLLLVVLAIVVIVVGDGFANHNANNSSIRKRPTRKRNALLLAPTIRYAALADDARHHSFFGRDCWKIC